LEETDIPDFPLPHGYNIVYSRPHPLLYWIGVVVNDTVKFYVYIFRDDTWKERPDMDFLFK